VANVIYAPEADDDLEAIVDYIARDKPMAARDFLMKIRETCETLANQPGQVKNAKGLALWGAGRLASGSTWYFSVPLTMASKSLA
jgi:toxin ParE1/3/4